MAYFPLFIELESKKALVAGGGRIAARRTGVLLEFGVRVTVVSPEISEEMRTLIAGAPDGRIVWIQREYESGDCETCELALAATNQREVNHRVFLDASAAGIPVNICDKKEECSFYFPGIAKSGSLVAGITAGGNDHGLARRMTEEVRNLFIKEGMINGE